MQIFETTLFFLLVMTLDIIIAIHILMNKHEEPTSATLWFFIVFSFPIFGVIIYLFFGINRIKTLGLKVQLANEKINLAQRKMVHQTLNKIHQDIQQHTFTSYKKSCKALDHNKTIDSLLPRTIPISGNNLTLLRNGTAAYPKMLAAIKRAETSIHLQSFIIHSDIIGKEILDALVTKAKSGVEVKILYDKFGSLKALFSHFFAKYKSKESNFQLRSFAFTNLFAPWRIQLRNHRKLLVVDGRIAFIGGINISSDNDIRVCNKDKYIHDLHCELAGPAVNALQLSFLRDWHYATKTPISQLFVTKYFTTPENSGDVVVRIIDSGPGQKYAATEKTFATATVTASKSLWIMTPYFAPDRAFISALIMATARGVEIKIIVPKKNNHWYAQFASRSLYKTLLRNNIQIYEKTGIFSHAKALIVDQQWAMMGSSNCDVRSFRLNYELDFIVEGSDFITDLQQQFERELAKSEQIKLHTLLEKKWHLQLIENLCSLLIPIL